jgi:hypothetical protein
VLHALPISAYICHRLLYINKERGEEIGGLRKLNNLYPLPNIIRVTKPRGVRWPWHIARMGGKRIEVIQMYGSRTQRKNTIKKTCRYDNNI